MKQKPASLRLTLLGVGAMNSPRYAPAGLLVEHERTRVIIDGGSVVTARIAAWLVKDERSELIRETSAVIHHAKCSVEIVRKPEIPEPKRN